ncbi:molybdopterin molybdenumtransferase MoeA [Agromyces fucosus]|uniref:Molybdopterin molybdenumtransferase n=1 Tax=Agromyces fucosus TaxID=41985 RepID=A0A4Q2JSE1_9MICO|nr:gephyrin-like molybdotransferase Glp [Agromyces fucosus]RXZ51235.1 molybdopterin molybdenumtransferase MoeA [Agromyces fucosus]
MRSYVEHQRAVHALLDPLASRLGAAGSERLELSAGSAHGRVLAEDVRSPIDLPGFDNSQMDGYAVRSAELTSARPGAPVRLDVGRTSAAGDAPVALEPGTASPVMTGAAIPQGADAVVPIEAVDPPAFLGLGSGRHDSPAGSIVGFTSAVEPGTFIRRAGSDIGAGSLLLPAGTRLGPAQLGSLAAAGVTDVLVRRPLRVLLLSTGHELRPPGQPLRPGQIHDANTAMIGAALRECGVEVAEALAPDDAASVRAAVEASVRVAPSGAARPADFVVTTGGVSAGAFEVVREALAPLGVEFVKVAIQPGGPQGLGIAAIDPDGGGAPIEIPVVSFPGNPVSALVSFELFLRPVLRELAGLAPDRARARLRLAHDVTSPLDKHQVRRGVLDGDGDVEVGAPSSHLLHAYANATVLVHLPVGVGDLPAGAHVDVWRIDD